MAHRPSHRDLAGLLSTSSLTTASPLPPGVSIIIDGGTDHAERLYVHGSNGTTSWVLRDDRAARRWGRIDGMWHVLRLPGTWACTRYDRALGIAHHETREATP